MINNITNLNQVTPALKKQLERMNANASQYQYVQFDKTDGFVDSDDQPTTLSQFLDQCEPLHHDWCLANWELAAYHKAFDILVASERMNKRAAMCQLLAKLCYGWDGAKTRKFWHSLSESDQERLNDEMSEYLLQLYNDHIDFLNENNPRGIRQ